MLVFDPVSSTPERRFFAKHDIFRSCQRLNQSEILEYHAHAEHGGVFRRADFCRIAVNQNLALIRSVYARQHTHHRTFSRPVLAKQRMNLSRVCRKIDLVARGY
ncbi:hypothetical protein D3C72_2107150 [compost metagenome]